MLNHVNIHFTSGDAQDRSRDTPGSPLTLGFKAPKLSIFGPYLIFPYFFLPHFACHMISHLEFFIFGFGFTTF